MRSPPDGNGMDAELIPRVFDLFVQGSPADNRHMGGLGLGLALVRALVEQHGGTIEARSEGPGKGSTFIVRLPCAARAPRFEETDVTPFAEPRAQ